MKTIAAVTQLDEEHTSFVKKCLGSYIKNIEIKYAQKLVRDDLTGIAAIVTFGKFAKLLTTTVLQDLKKEYIYQVNLPHPKHLMKEGGDPEKRQAAADSLAKLKEYIDQTPSDISIDPKQLPSLEEEEIRAIQTLAANNTILLTTKDGTTLAVGPLQSQIEADIKILPEELVALVVLSHRIKTTGSITIQR